MLEDLETTRSRVQLSKAAIQAILEETLASSDGLETGGILLGSEHEGGFVVQAAGGPGPNAVREERFVLRDLQHATLLAEDAWRDSRSQWIGEWHSHPTGVLEPSPMDLASYVSHLDDPELGFDVFLALITTLHRSGTRIAAWAVTTKSLTLLSVERLNDD